MSCFRGSGRSVNHSIHLTLFQIPTCNPNLQPASCNLQPATCNLQPATCNLQLATCNLQPATCNLQPANYTLHVETLYEKLNTQRPTNAKDHYSYLFFYKMNKGDLPLMYFCFFFLV